MIYLYGIPSSLYDFVNNTDYNKAGLTNFFFLNPPHFDVFTWIIPNNCIFKIWNNPKWQLLMQVAYVPIRQPQTAIACPLPAEKLSFLTILTPFAPTVWAFFIASIFLVRYKYWLFLGRKELCQPPGLLQGGSSLLCSNCLDVIHFLYSWSFLLIVFF